MHTFHINVLILILSVLHMFQTSCVHHLEGHLYLQFLWYVFHAGITIKGYINFVSIKYEVLKILIKA